jgi:8-oxo-dGTP pyrophosphatase MutT (NUDIX family)
VTYTALRETFEEIGLNPQHFDIWGTLTPSPTSRVAAFK